MWSGLGEQRQYRENASVEPLSGGERKITLVCKAEVWVRSGCRSQVMRYLSCVRRSKRDHESNSKANRPETEDRYLFFLFVVHRKTSLRVVSRSLPQGGRRWSENVSVGWVKSAERRRLNRAAHRAHPKTHQLRKTFGETFRPAHAQTRAHLALQRAQPMTLAWRITVGRPAPLL